MQNQDKSYSENNNDIHSKLRITDSQIENQLNQTIINNDKEENEKISKSPLQNDDGNKNENKKIDSNK